MIQPNNNAYLFCVWLLTSSFQRFSTARVNLITTVRNAALAGTTVTQHQWNEFINVTQLYYPAYSQNVNLQPNVFTGIILDTLTTYWLSYVTNPTTQTIYAVDAFFKQLRADGNLALDYFFLFAQDQQANAKISIINPNLYTVTEHGSVSWAANLGYTGNGTNMYLSTNYINSVNGVNATKNSNSMGYYGRKIISASVAEPMGVADGTNSSYVIPNYTGGITYYNINQSVDTSYSNSTTQGLLISARLSSTSLISNKNGVTLATSSQVSSNQTTKADYIIAFNNGGSPAAYDTNQFTLAFRGAGSLNFVTFNSAVNLLMTNLGAHY